MISPLQVAAVWTDRAREQGQAVERMTELAKAYNSDLDLAITDLYRNEKPAAANLLFVNVNQYAMRVANPDPNLVFPPLRSGIATSEKRADQRRRVSYGWFENNDMPAIRLQRAMWLITFSHAPVVLRPDKDTQSPVWEVRDPRRFYPSDNRMRPRDAVAQGERTWGWLQDRYAGTETMDRLNALYKKPTAGGPGQGWERTRRVRLLEWWDADVCMTIALGDTPEPGVMMPLSPDQKAAVIEVYPNLAGVTPVSCPTPVSLDPDSPRSQFDGMAGSFEMRSRLLALSYIAVEKGVFPEEWAYNPNPMSEPDIKVQPNPRQGITGVLAGGQIFRQPPDAQFASGQMIDRLEYQERQGGSAPPEFGGHGATNTRTGRRGAQVMGATVDEYIATYQLRLAASMVNEIDIAARIDRAYFGDVEKEMLVTLKGSAGAVKYRPNDIWETTTVKVRYPFAGVDISNLTLEAGQLVGLEALSREKLMEYHPLIENVEEERDRIVSENVERAFFQNLLTMAADPASPVTMAMLAEFRRLVLSDRMEWWEAWAKLEADAQAAQQEIAAGQMEQPMPGIDGGLVPPGPVAPAEATLPGLQELGGMLMATRGPRMTVRGEQAA